MSSNASVLLRESFDSGCRTCPPSPISLPRSPPLVEPRITWSKYERIGDDELVFSAQLTGDPPDPVALDFSCLQLGGTGAAVRQQPGAPSEIRSFERAEAGVAGVVWSYDPLPISIEVVDGRVYSFRVWRPDDVPARRRTLTLLKKP